MIAISMLLIAPTFGAPIQTQDQASKLTDALLAHMQRTSPEEFLPVDIVLTEQVPSAVIADMAKLPTKPLRRAAVTALLQDTAASTQGELVAFLREEQQAGNVQGRIGQLWISNVVSVQARSSTILELAARADVGSVHLDLPRGEEVLVGRASATQGGADAPTCGLSLIQAPQTWNQLGVTGKGVVVGVIDTGLCATHPDIAGQRWCNPDELPANGIDDDGNGYIDDRFGWNFESNNPDTNDANSHGSHTSGTVAGDGANGTQCGVAPDARIMTLKFWNSFSGEQSVWDSMQYGVANGADVLTASIGWPHSFSPNRAVWRQVCDNAVAAGVIVVYAAGNEGCGPGIDNVRTPGDVPSVITAGAVDCNSSLAGFSSCGPVSWTGVAPYNDFPFPPGLTKPDVAAPGVSTTSHQLCNGYVDFSGTSMSTPHIAGVAALLLEANPNLDQAGVKALLESTAVDLGATGKDNQYGAGLVQARTAVLAAIGQGNFCAPKMNSCGTLPMITMTGFPSATATSGFTVTGSNMAGLALGVLVYSDQGSANLPFLGGSLCINNHRRAVGVVDTLGTSGQCNGSISIDMNSFRAGLLGGDPLPSLSIPGTTVHCQYWGRDTANTFGVLLSGAFKYFVCP